MLLSRSPLASTRRWVPFDLHVLGAPPAFILSQDRTLRPDKLYWARRARPASDAIADRIHSISFAIASSCWKGMTRLSPYHTLYSVHHCYHRNGIRSVSRRMHQRCSASQYPVLKVRAVRYARCRAAGINNARDPGHRLVAISSSPFLHISPIQPPRDEPGTPGTHGVLSARGRHPLQFEPSVRAALSPSRYYDWAVPMVADRPPRMAVCPCPAEGPGGVATGAGGRAGND